jgi:hypothetical protein
MTEKSKKSNVESKSKAAKSGGKKKIAPKLAMGVAAASGATLIAITMIGVAPTVLAGAVGYFAYCGMTGQKV